MNRRFVSDAEGKQLKEQQLKEDKLKEEQFKEQTAAAILREKSVDYKFFTFQHNDDFLNPLKTTLAQFKQFVEDKNIADFVLYDKKFGNSDDTKILFQVTEETGKGRSLVAFIYVQLERILKNEIEKLYLLNSLILSITKYRDEFTKFDGEKFVPQNPQIIEETLQQLRQLKQKLLPKTSEPIVIPLTVEKSGQPTVPDRNKLHPGGKDLSSDDEFGQANLGQEEEDIDLVAHEIEPDFCSQLDTYIVKRWNQVPASKRNEKELKIDEVPSLTEEQIPKPFSGQFKRFLAGLFGGHDAKDKISAALKVRQLLSGKIGNRPLTPVEKKAIANSISLTEFSALEGSELGVIMNKNKQLWPQELLDLDKKFKETREFIQYKASK